MTPYDPAEDIAAIRVESEQAFGALIGALSAVLAEADRISVREPEAAEAIRAAGLSALEACTFQDLLGQRLTRVSEGRCLDPLLQGPAGSERVSDDEINALFA